MKPVTAIVILVVVFLIIIGIVLWQIGVFEGAEVRTPPIDILGTITPTALTGTGIPISPPAEGAALGEPPALRGEVRPAG
ncbi:MAG: hypothetical protein QME51_07085, partial [Planctomycetota bacterium]|nr:hypothetical protein [Planctomycetota bacterium]